MLLIPSTVQVLHALDQDHHHEMVHSLDQNDAHFDEECSLCELIYDTSGLLENPLNGIFLRAETPEYVHTYRFLKEDQPLSYSLRGPPTS